MSEHIGWLGTDYIDYLGLKDFLERQSGGNPYLASIAHGNTHKYHRDHFVQDVINLSGYDYLGLNENEQVRRACADAAKTYGVSTAASRVASGELDIHHKLERSLSSFLGAEASVVMVGGHATNVCTVGHLFKRNFTVICDQYSHNSIMVGAQLSGAPVLRFRHNDLDDLVSKLEEARTQHVAVCVEGLYSMDGDLPPLADIVALKKSYDFILYVDEAHSIGTVGETGRGVCEATGVPPTDVDVIMGTLSKTLASCGGFIAGSKTLVDYIKATSPGFVFSTGLPAPLCAAALKALEILDNEPSMVAELRRKSNLLADKLELENSGTPIVPVMTPADKCYSIAAQCVKRGVNVFPVTYPAVPHTKSRLRLFVSRLHSTSQISFAAQVVADSIQLI